MSPDIILLCADLCWGILVAVDFVESVFCSIGDELGGVITTRCISHVYSAIGKMGLHTHKNP